MLIRSIFPTVVSKRMDEVSIKLKTRRSRQLGGMIMRRVNVREITAFTQDVITHFLVSGGNANQFITFDDVYVHKIPEVKKTSSTYEDWSDNITRTFFVP